MSRKTRERIVGFFILLSYAWLNVTLIDGGASWKAIGLANLVLYFISLAFYRLFVGKFKKVKA